MVSAVFNDNAIASEAGEITVYNYDAITREYTTEAVEYLPIGVGLPANACTDVPPDAKIGFILCRTPNNDGWEYVEDHRGETVYDTTTRQPFVITLPGTYSVGMTKIAPETPYDIWNGVSWVKDSDAEHAAAVKSALFKQQALTDEAIASVNLLQLKLQAGRKLTVTEMTRLNIILDYIDSLDSISIDKGKDIIWPKKPVF